MPPFLVDRLAVVSLVGVLLIPVAQSSLRGLDHALTCRQQVATPFRITPTADGYVVTGSTSLSADQPTTLCGGLIVDLSVAARDEGVELRIPISNQTDADWFGTVQLEVASIRVPVDLGRVPAGATVTRIVPLDLPDGTVEFDGVLLIGP